MQLFFPSPLSKQVWSDDDDDEDSESVSVPTFFVALAGQTADVVLLSGGGSDKLLQAGH